MWFSARGRLAKLSVLQVCKRAQRGCTSASDSDLVPERKGLLRLFDRKRLDGTVNSYGTPVTVFFNETEWKWAGFELRG